MTVGPDSGSGRSLIAAPSPVMDRRIVSVRRVRTLQHKKRTTMSVIAASVFIVAGLSMVIAPGGIGQTNTWTFLVYLDADNDLEYWGIEDFLEMASVGSNADLNIVVQFDRHPIPGGSGFDDRYDDWSGTLRYLVTPGMTPTVENATWDIGEVNMGDPETLISFVNWGVANYSANHYVLVLWDHGANWDGIAWDYSDSMDYLDMFELDYALDEIMVSNGDLFWDIIAFDACNMGSIEVAHQISPYAQYMVGSEIGVPEAGFDYGGSLAALASNPDMTALDFGREILNATSDYYLSLVGTPLEYMLNESFTLSIVDLGLLPSVVSAVDDLSLALMENITAWVNHVSLAWDLAEKYDGVDSEDVVDLYHISEILQDVIPNGTIDGLAGAVMASFQQAVLAEVHGTNPANPMTPVNHTHGMTIYFPYFWIWPPFAYQTWLYFAMDTNWDEFLSIYYNEVGLGNPTVMYSSPEGAGVPTTSTIVIWFSEFMDFASLEAAFSISPSVLGTLTWETIFYPEGPAEYMLAFTPSEELSPGVTYTVTIGTDAMDTEGNHLTSPYSWQFSTGEVIPEFSTVVLPAMGVIAVLALVRRFRKP